MSPILATLASAGAVVLVNLLTAVYVYGRLTERVHNHGLRLDAHSRRLDDHGNRLVLLEKKGK